MSTLIKLSFILILTYLSIFCQGQTQKIFHVKGFVNDHETHEALVGANILILPQQKIVTTNLKGEFEISTRFSNPTFITSFIGYKTDTLKLNILKDSNIVIALITDNQLLNGVEVSYESNNITSDMVGAVKLKSSEIEALPGFLGEHDVLQTLKLMPGIQAAGEGNVGLYVRGGDAGQNLILLDDIPVYNPSHLLGFYPVFNTDAIQNVTMLKGGIPANYGGKISSVIDIEQKEGNRDKVELCGSVSLISGDLTLQFPIFNRKGSVIISGRRTYLSLLQTAVKPFTSESSNLFNSTHYTFYDSNGKITYRLTPKDQIFVSWFLSKDSYDFFNENFGLDNQMTWKNGIMGFKFRHQFNSNLLGEVQLYQTRYNFELGAGFDQYSFNLFSNIQDFGSKLKFIYAPNPNLHIEYGAVYIQHQIEPHKVGIDVKSIKFNSDNVLYSDESSAYINCSVDLKSNWKVVLGARSTLYRHIGPYTSYTNGIDGLKADSIVYPKSKLVKPYFFVDPNLAAVYTISNDASIKTSMSITHQFVHLASVGSVSLPTDIWLPSTDYLHPQTGQIVSLGYFRNWLDQILETSVEAYYKHLEHQIEFKNGIIQNFDNSSIKENLVEGKGDAYGIEFFVKKSKGNPTGWVSYTLSKTTRNFPDLNGGKPFPAKYDRTHELTATASYKLNEKWNVSSTFIYATGNAMTLPKGRYIVQGYIGNDYTSVNGFRMPPYHRMDISFNYLMRKTGSFESSLNFSVYNLYNRANPYYVYYWAKGDVDRYYLNVIVRQISLFPILPSITWNFKF